MAIATATVVDDTGQYSGSLDLIGRNALAGFDEWRPYLASTVGSIQIEIHLVEARPDVLASGGPVVGIGIGPSTLESGAAFELRTGNDLNGADSDIFIELDADFLSSVQIDRLDGSPIESGKTNLVSVLAHEIGHGLGIDGFLDDKTYAPAGEDYDSVFDEYLTVTDGAPFFTGPEAMAVYGGPVPQSREHLYHVGNYSGSGSDIETDLMFYAAHPGTTHVSRLDGAILSDIGLATIFDDVLVGAYTRDTIFGGQGDDEVYAFGGDDSVSGDEGADYLRGGDGADRITGGTGFDDINGNVGNDTAFGGLDGDWVVGGKDDDLLSGDEGADIVYGNLGVDWCDGGAGNDTVRGGQDDDKLFGQEGDDWLSGDKGSDTLTGGSGADIFHTFGDAGLDRVTDFNRAQGDRVLVDPGTVYTVAQSGADVVISMTGGGQMVLADVQISSLTGDWIFGA